MTVLLPTLLAIATIAGAGMILPQVIRVRRTRLVDGLSPEWVGAGIVMNMWWTAYAIESDLLGLLPVSILGVALYAYLAFQFVIQTGQGSVAALVRGAASLGFVPLAFLVVAGWQGAGLAIGLCYGVQFAPAVVAARRSDRVDGISPTTWILAWVEAVIWFGYGTTNGDFALLVGGGGGSVMATLILIRLVAVAKSTGSQGTQRSENNAPDLVACAQHILEPRRSVVLNEITDGRHETNARS